MNVDKSHREGTHNKKRTEKKEEEEEEGDKEPRRRKTFKESMAISVKVTRQLSMIGTQK